jgi:hypothetical protein
VNLICAIVPDLMDRSRIAAILPDVRFVASPAECVGADAVIVDGGRRADAVAGARAHAPGARIVVFVPHVDGDAATGARRDGADAVLARSRFFRDVAAAVR